MTKGWLSRFETMSSQELEKAYAARCRTYADKESFLYLIGLGANRLFPSEAIAGGLNLLSSFGTIEKESPIYITKSLRTGDPEFRNSVALFRTSLLPGPLLEVIHLIERILGRRREKEERWAPRTLDIDLLFSPDFAFSASYPQLPHPGLFLRPFVYYPAKALFRSLPPFEGDVAQWEGFEISRSEKTAYKKIRMVRVSCDISLQTDNMDADLLARKASFLPEDGELIGRAGISNGSTLTIWSVLA